MNDKITLLYNVQNEVTVLPNKFIDEYMIKADGEYVKIYLLILRLQGMGLPVDVDHLADHLELTRKDVLRALSYWEKAGLLQAAEPSVPGEDSFYSDTEGGFFTTGDSFTDDHFCTGEDYIKSYGCGEFYEGYRS